MGELILCNQALAALPYYLEEASLNIYSLEELSYYIANNAYLLGAEFMNEELCNWVEKELGLKDTAQKLREIYRSRRTLWEFVACILEESGYCDRAQQKHIIHVLQELESKSEFECGKIRADRFLENGKYVNCIYEYRRLLQEDEKNPVLLGNVWHNLGCAYARLFFFEKAAKCFRNAYQQNENPESLRECMYAYRCLGDKAAYAKAAEEFQISEEMQLEIAEKVKTVSNLPDIREFEQEIDAATVAGETEKIEIWLEEWKDTYRKNCRI